MDPAARQARIEANGITQFYADQLHDAKQMNKTLCEEITSLQNKINSLLMANQNNLNQVQEKVTKQRLENQGLKSQIESLKTKLKLMQMRINYSMAKPVQSQPGLAPSPFSYHPSPLSFFSSHPQSAAVPGSSTGHEFLDIAVDPNL
ncbi:hypothetical protein PCANC_10126 [Puccinia coronata f. sp. avenae]|uniref:Uncharacterized protein n=1 Tax=Puccinia coronata f. sp. avenae TaxID=200324 RepID=A0A2N5V6B3_9BASI|nr:hypothetical protein PCASD_23925 [Puccinia coronata f. sp. avenae]PLW20313.1 hypothetical protein PCANC_08449 [Puccinia coronata f. sp. avenae]PLW45533.1 hypothetical protein PCANC_10126 [Puccinia coronata f. sp. avenae]